MLQAATPSNKQTVIVWLYPATLKALESEARRLGIARDEVAERALRLKLGLDPFREGAA